MKSTYKILSGMLCVLGFASLLSCRPSNANVSLHGVNYSDREFSYFIADPENPKKSLGGEHIGPFAGGGTTCCASLPRKWKPGTKVQLTTIHWLKKLPDGSLPEVTEEHDVEVPEYAEPGELWVIRDVNGKISLVSSNLQPDHPSWPGKVKGWPTPSLDFQRERWELYRKLEAHNVDLFQSLLSELDHDPAGKAHEAWAFDKEYSPAKIAKFTGPDDRRYIDHLRTRYTEGLRLSRNQLEEVMKAKP
jgi:hypothetical protein